MKTKSRRWMCNDILMYILPMFRRPQLGLKLALLSPRFNALVDKHFDGQSQLTILRKIRIEKMNTMAKLCVIKKSNAKPIKFPLPDHPLHNKIRFNYLQIDYIDHSVIKFLHASQQIFDKGINLNLQVPHFSCNSYAKNVHAIWSVFAREIWPIFAPNIRHLSFSDSHALENLCRHTSPTVLSDLNITSIYSNHLLPTVIGDAKGPNATAGQALTKWLQMPTKDGKPKQLRCCGSASKTNKFVKDFKEVWPYFQ